MVRERVAWLGIDLGELNLLYEPGQQVSRRVDGVLFACTQEHTDGLPG